MSEPLLTQEQGDFVIARWHEGAKAKAILAEMGEAGQHFTAKQIHCWISWHRGRRPIERRLAVSRRVALEMNQQGMRAAEIAAAMGRSVRSVHKVLRDARA